MEILGLIDTLESMILDAFKIPFSKKIVVDEERVLSVIDKIRLVVQGGGNIARKAVDKDRRERNAQIVEVPAELKSEQGKATDIIEQAYKLAKEVREGADKYADEVLSNLELTSTRILRTINAGRERLKHTVQGEREENEV